MPKNPGLSNFPYYWYAAIAASTFQHIKINNVLLRIVAQKFTCV